MDISNLLRKWFQKSQVPSEKPQLDEKTLHLIHSIDKNGLSYLGSEALCDLVLAMAEINNHHIPGIVVETGCAMGGSSIVLTATKGIERKLNIYDVFGMIPAPSEQDGPEVHKRYALISSGQAEGLKGNSYYGYDQDLLTTVKDNFTQAGYPPSMYNVNFIKGLYKNTIHIDCPIALAHIDCDWYESVKLCLERIGPHISPGGKMILDDYDFYSGCRVAVDEFYHENNNNFRMERHSRVHLVRNIS